MSAIKKIAFGIMVILCLVVLYLLTWPVPISPRSWQPPISQPPKDLWPTNHALAAVSRLELVSGHGPEDVAVDKQGRVYGGLRDGRIVRWIGGKVEDWVDTGGRPLGLHFDREWNLIVADANRGLLSVAPDGQIRVLTQQSDGVPFLFTDDLDIANDGIIYFSDASSRFDQSEYHLDALEHGPNGRLLSYDPASGQTTTLMKGLYFANGVAISPQEDFVLVNETWNYRVLRYWIEGEKKGQTEVFIDNLPGFPDGISSNEQDTFWLALASPRNPLMDQLADKPFLRKVVARLPKILQPAPIRYAFVVGLDVQGRVTFNLQEPDNPPFAFITSVQEHEGILYLGSLEESAAGYIRLPTTDQSK